MNILFISVAWPAKGERNLYHDLMFEFTKHTHKAYVLAADHTIKEAQIDLEDNLNVHRVPVLQVNKTSMLKKAISLPMLSYTLWKYSNKQLSDLKIDLIISHSPPITLSGLFIKLKKKFNAPFYYLLKDIWPHGTVDLGLMSNKSPLYYLMRWHEKRLYKNVDRIGCMSPLNVKYILQHNPWLSESKVEVCPNSIHARELSSINKYEVRSRHGIPENSLVLIFSGNLAYGHGLYFYMNLIESFKDDSRVHFLIGGSGTHYGYIKSEKHKRNLPNLTLYEKLPKEEFDAVLQSSDVGVILLDKAYKVPQFPSRLLAYLEAGKPVLCIANNNTDMGRILEEAKCGVAVDHGNLSECRKTIISLLANEPLLKTMGENSKKLLLEKYDVKQTVKLIEESIKNLNRNA